MHVARRQKREGEWNREKEMCQCYGKEIQGAKIRMGNLYKKMQHNMKFPSPKEMPSSEVVKTEPVKFIVKNEKDVSLKSDPRAVPSEKHKPVTLEKPKPAVPEKITTCIKQKAISGQK